GHRVEELHVKVVGGAAGEGAGDGFRGGAMAGAGVRKEEKETVRGGHDRSRTASEQPFGGAHLLARSNGDQQVVALEHLRVRRVDAQLSTALANGEHV